MEIHRARLRGHRLRGVCLVNAQISTVQALSGSEGRANGKTMVRTKDSKMGRTKRALSEDARNRSKTNKGRPSTAIQKQPYQKGSTRAKNCLLVEKAPKVGAKVNIGAKTGGIEKLKGLGGARRDSGKRKSSPSATSRTMTEQVETKPVQRGRKKKNENEKMKNSKKILKSLDMSEQAEAPANPYARVRLSLRGSRPVHSTRVALAKTELLLTSRVSGCLSDNVNRSKTGDKRKSVAEASNVQTFKRQRMYS